MCPNCNAPVRPDSDFCTNCGTRVRPPGGTPTNEPVPPPREPVAPAGPAGYGPPGPAGYGPSGPSFPIGQPNPMASPSPVRPGGPPNPAGPGGPGGPGGAGGPGGPPSQGRQLASHPFRFDLTRLAAADKTIGGASIVVFISLFLPWYGAFGASASGMTAHGYLVITLLTSIALIGYLVLRAGWDTPAIRLPIAHAPLLLVGTGVQLLFVLIAFLQSEGTSHEIGSYLGLLAALLACGVIAVPVIRSMLDTQRGGIG